MYAPFFHGFAVGGGLIVAIGAQNAFLLNQSIKGNHALLIAAICFTCDVALISAGVGGLGAAVHALPILSQFLTYGGALFLGIYGLRSLYQAWGKNALLPSDARAHLTRKQAIGLTLAVTLLNPHVYIDTLLLFGAISTQYEGFMRPLFAGGAILASFLWFTSLAVGGQALAPYLSRPRVWQAIETLIGGMMLFIAFNLVM